MENKIKRKPGYTYQEKLLAPDSIDGWNQNGPQASALAAGGGCATLPSRNAPRGW
jgi:hypothetical protein